MSKKAFIKILIFIFGSVIWLFLTLKLFEYGLTDINWIGGGSLGKPYAHAAGSIVPLMLLIYLIYTIALFIRFIVKIIRPD